MLWVLDYLTDIASDFSAIHHIHDVSRMEGPVFFQMALRLAAYPGVVASWWLSRSVQAAPEPTRRSEPAPLTSEALAGVNARLASVGQPGLRYTKVPADA